MYDSKTVRRRRVVLGLLVACSLILLTASFGGDGGAVGSVQRGFSEVLNPVQEGASRALKPVRDLIDWFDETWTARGENDKLKSQVASLRQELMDTQDAAEKAGYAQDLQALLEDGGLTAYTPVDASVIGRSPSLWYSTIKISAGSSDGVARNDAVITQDGLIGHVTEVTGGTAVVSLITDSRNAVTARVVGKGPEGVVEPIVGATGKLSFGLIQGEEDVKDGDRLVTAGFTTESGLASRYPADIPIGQVVETIPAQDEQKEQVNVEPFADLADLSEVTVLTSGGSGQ